MPTFMFALAIVAAAAIILAMIVIIESAQQRAGAKVRATPRAKPRRQPQLEDAIRSAFDGPAAKHGAIFDSYSVWKRDHETRLELGTNDAFGRLNEFTRSLIVRHLWRALERLSRGAVVMVDNPPQMWSESVDNVFHDHGIDPWRLPPVGLIPAPQFAKE
jgi:hypothetical protein